MCVDVSHLVFEAESNSKYEVVDDGLYGSESGDIFPSTVVELYVDRVFVWAREADGKVGEILHKLAYTA